jgi:hypothetical protein
MNRAVSSGSPVDITCGPATGQAWPDGIFYVHLTAAASTSLTGCNHTLTTSRAVNIIKKPDVTFNQVTEPQKICSDETSVSLTYTLSSGASGVNVTLKSAAAMSATASDIDCQLPASPLDQGELQACGAFITGTSRIHAMCVTSL